jgi:16S rRNA (cytidine1402-2'-O)-methyltransferase
VLDRLARGERVALVSDAGLPGVSDPGSRLIRAVAEAGLDVTVLPGASSVETALVASGFAGGGYRFVGYVPRRANELTGFVQEIARWPEAVVAFESPRRLPTSLAALAAEMPERPAAVCRELTKRFEEVVRGTLQELATQFADAPKGEVTVVIGAASGGSRVGGAEKALDAVAELVAAGVPRRKAAEVIAGLTGASKNDLYRGSL